MQNELATLFNRDLLKLKNEMQAYTSGENLWKIVPGISNAGGNLCLHLLGNTQYFIGNVLGKTGYVRNRPAEFSDKDIPVQTITELIDHTISVATSAIRELDDMQLEKEYPEKVFAEPMTTKYFLLHLLGHLNYHLGQINYHRRMIEGGTSEG